MFHSDLLRLRSVMRATWQNGQKSCMTSLSDVQLGVAACERVQQRLDGSSRAKRRGVCQHTASLSSRSEESEAVRGFAGSQVAAELQNTVWSLNEAVRHTRENRDRVLQEARLSHEVIFQPQALGSLFTHTLLNHKVLIPRIRACRIARLGLFASQVSGAARRQGSRPRRERSDVLAG